MDLFRGSISQDDQLMNLPMNTDSNRYDKPVRNPLDLTGMTGPGPMSLLRREMSTVAEVGRAQIVLTEPSRCQATDVEVEGTVTDTRASIPYRCCDCSIRMTTGHNSVMTANKDKEPRPIRTYPVRQECGPIEGETVILRPMNLLDVPALRLPGVFLKLAEEARNSEVVDDQPSGMSAVQSHRSGQAGRVMITEIIDSFPVLGSGASRVSRTSTEVIPDLNLVEPVIRLGPVGHLRDTEQPIMLSVKTNQGRISPPGPVGQHVLMAGRMEMMDQPDPVGPDEEMEMFHIQPVVDGPAGLVRTRHPVGNVMLPALQDGVRPSAGGPVGRFPDPLFRICSKNSSPDDSYQPLVTGPLGANVSDASNDTGQPTVGDPLDRPTSLDPMGPRAMLSLGNGNQPASIGPVGRPWMTGQLEIQTGEPEYERSTQTRSGSVSAAVKPDPAIRTGGGVRTDDMKFDTINGQSESCTVSPSSDSGVHSLGEQWEYMSTCSGNSDSIPTVKTVSGGVASQADSPQDTRGVVFSHKETYGERDSMSYMSTNGHNSDIADMSDFSDEEDEPREEDGPHEDVQPNIRTDWVGDDSIKKESNSCDQSVLHTSTTEVAPHELDPNDKEYWTKFRLLTKQAFLLDDVKLSESDYPDAVKELVFRFRLTIMEINERDDVRFEQSHYSDDDCDSSLSDYYDCRHKLDDYKDWHYNRSPIVDSQNTDGAFKSEGNADNADGHDLTLEMEIEDKIDVCSEPDARAKFELSPTKHVVELDKIGVNCITDGDVTVNKGNVAGDSDTHEDEYIRVSMISVDKARRGTSEHIHKSLRKRDCVITECGKQPNLSAYRDSELCNEEPLQNMMSNCFGVCSSTKQFYSPDFEWCVECVDKLIWGFLVSCVVSFVMKNRSVGTNVFMKGSGVCVSTWGLLDGLITPCDAIHECLWRTEDFKDILNNVMLGNRAMMISHDTLWG